MSWTSISFPRTMIQGLHGTICEKHNVLGRCTLPSRKSRGFIWNVGDIWSKSTWWKFSSPLSYCAFAGKHSGYLDTGFRFREVYPVAPWRLCMQHRRPNGVHPSTTPLPPNLCCTFTVHLANSACVRAIKLKTDVKKPKSTHHVDFSPERLRGQGETSLMYNLPTGHQGRIQHHSRRSWHPVHVPHASPSPCTSATTTPIHTPRDACH